MRGSPATERLLRAAASTSSSLAPDLAARLLEQLFLKPRRHRRPAREEEWLSDAETRPLRLERGLELPLHTWGAGPAVLLAHGWSGRGSQLGLFARALAARGLRAVAFDAPGHGAAGGRLTGAPEMGLALARVAYEVGPVRGVIAHSLGTVAATLAASRGVDLGRLVFVAPPVDPRDYLQRAARWLGFSEEVRRRAQARIERRFALPLAAARTTSLAPEIEAPLLVIHDRGDRDVPYAEGAQLAERWPAARLHSTEGLGHYRILRDPAVVAAAADFLVASR